MQKLNGFVLCGLVALMLTGCYYRTDSPRGSWAKGSDLSWLSEMEHDGVKFYNGENGENGDASLNDANGSNGEDCIEPIYKR